MTPMKASPLAATVAPIARVLPLIGLSLLDRHFDYLVKEADSDAVAPGVRVRVRFAGRKVEAIVLERLATSDFTGDLSFIDSVVSPRVVAPPRTMRLVQDLALRYGGTRSDVYRLAIPPRYAGAETSDFSTPWEDLGKAEEPDLSSWMSYAYGQSFVDAIVAGKTARAAWQILPGDDWHAGIAALATKVALDGGGVLIVVPDQETVDLIEAAAKQTLSAKQVLTYTASLGPQARYRRFLAVLAGQARVVIGTRSAAYLPVANLKLACVFDDGNELLVEPRAPYCHSRDVLTTVSAHTGCGLIIAGHGRTAETQALVEQGWLHNLVAPRDVIRQRAPRVQAIDEFILDREPAAAAVRLPNFATQAIRNALTAGRPALVLVPRSGYIPVLACERCRTPARCRACHGPLELPQMEGQQIVSPQCRWCGRIEGRFTCIECGSHQLRARVVGSQRTAEEIGRNFPNVPIVHSGGKNIVREIPETPKIVVATPGAQPRVAAKEGEPGVAGHYGTLVCLDTWAQLTWPDLRAAEDALNLWLTCASMVAPASQGGEVAMVAENSYPAVQALVRWDPVGFAAYQLAERSETGLPPATRMAAIDGPMTSLEFVEHALTSCSLKPELLGPVDLPVGVHLPADYDSSKFGPAMRLLVRVPVPKWKELGKALHAVQVQRVAAKDNLPMRIQVDPIHFG